MNELVVDASIAVKWVVEEDGTTAALALRRHKVIAPDLLIPECANVLWKKVVRGELERTEAQIAARLIAAADVELVSMRAQMEQALRLAVRMNHPAYDCIYLALAIDRDCLFVTADKAFADRARSAGTRETKRHIGLLGEAVRYPSP
jgi:predicted nucleic acid-binding protein